MTSKLVAKVRANRGAINDLIDDAWASYKAHGRESWADAFKEATANKVVQRYETKIRNGFKRAGVELPEGELTLQSMEDVIKDRTGLELDGLSPDSVMAAVDKLLSARLSQAIGVPVSTVFDKDAMLESINAAVLEAIRSGRAAEFVNKAAMHAARRYMTYKRRGIDAADAKKLAARAAQKRYRATHRLVWD